MFYTGVRVTYYYQREQQNRPEKRHRPRKMRRDGTASVLNHVRLLVSVLVVGRFVDRPL